MKKKNRLWIKLFIVMSIASLLTNSCKKEKLEPVPSLTTSAISNITQSTAICGGIITSEGIDSVKVKGVCWSIWHNPTTANSYSYGTGKVSFISKLTGLKSNTTYYVRAYANNSAGNAYGNEVSFILWLNVPGPSVTDVDGNTYNSVKIGNQVWTVENLKVTKYNDSTAIPLVTDGDKWFNLTTPGYCWYQNDEATYENTYGALYNWYTVNTNKLCPSGWHVPTDPEWIILTNYLGGDTVAGYKVKEIDIAHWHKPNLANNESGFTALPGGYRTDLFNLIGSDCRIWSSSENQPNYAWGIGLHYNKKNLDRWNSSKLVGYSVRCIKDY